MDQPLTGPVLEIVASRFRALGEPLRLRLLQELRDGERTVGDLVAAAGTSQANVSKHLALLAHAGLVRRRREGLNVFYAVADPDLFRLCDLVCGGARRHFESQAAHLPRQEVRARPARASRG